MIYILAFLVAYVCFWYADKSKKSAISDISNNSLRAVLKPLEPLSTRKQTIKFTLFAVGGLFALSLLASLRSSDIGTDVNLYIKPFYAWAIRFTSFKEYFAYFGFGSVTSDPLFFLLTYTLANVNPDYHIGLFVYEFLILGFFYLGIYRYSEIFGFKKSLAMLWMVLLFYNITLNTVRQMIAVAIIFFATSFLLTNNKKAFFILLIIAILFHSSGIIGIGIYGLFKILCDKKNHPDPNKQTLKTVLFIIAFLFVLLFAGFAIRFLVSVGILRDNYLNYLPGGDYESSGLARSVLVLPFILLSLVFFDSRKKQEIYPNYLFFEISAFVNFVLSFSTIISHNIVRMTYYFIPFIVVALTANPYTGKKRKRVDAFMTVVLFVAWLVNYVIKNYGETYPYVFYWDS